MTADPFLIIDQTPISWGQALRYLEESEQLGPVIGSILRQYVLEQAIAARPEMTVTSAEMEAAIAQLQQAQGITDAAQFEQWLTENGLDFERLCARVAFQLKVDKLSDQVTESKLPEYFIERKLLLDQVVLSRIVVADRDLAEELCQLIQEGEAFEPLAREYSLSPDRLLNGMMGAIARGDLSDLLRAHVDAAQPGDLIGPLQLEDGWMLFRVEAFQFATFEQPEVQAQLRQELFDRWLTDQIQQREIEVQLGY